MSTSRPGDREIRVVPGAVKADRRASMMQNSRLIYPWSASAVKSTISNCDLALKGRDLATFPLFRLRPSRTGERCYELLTHVVTPSSIGIEQNS